MPLHESPRMPSTLRRRLAWVVLAALGGVAPEAGAAQATWPEPLAVARAFAEAYPTTAAVSYIPALSWHGSIRLTRLTGEARWLERARSGMAPLLDGPRPADGEQHRLTSLAGYAAAAALGRADVDDAEAAGRGRAAAELVVPRGGSAPVRFATGWTDDMFMATWLLAAAASGLDDPLLETAAGLLVDYVERLQRADGLFVHAADAPHAWGRGNGFAALGLTEALARLPDRAPGRSQILAAYRSQMAALLAHQSDDGSWRQVVDVPESYRELSVTAMAVAAMARGVRHGWLDAPTFRPALERGWEAVVARIGPDGSVRDVCTSTGAGPTLEYYLERPSVTGMDDRGGGLVLTAALEMVELQRSSR